MLKLMAPLTVNDDRQKPIHAEDKKNKHDKPLNYDSKWNLLINDLFLICNLSDSTLEKWFRNAKIPYWILPYSSMKLIGRIFAFS